MARVVRTAPEVVLGSKSVASGTYPGSPATYIVDWAESGGLIPGELPVPGSLSTVAVLWTGLKRSSTP